MKVYNFVPEEILYTLRSWYMLKKIHATGEELHIYLETPSGRIEYSEGFYAHKMEDDSIILSCIYPWIYKFFNNFIITNGVEEEIVQTQLFEYVETMHRKLPSNTEGMFIFTDSIDISEDCFRIAEQHRCDGNFFGPINFGMHVPYPLKDPIGAFITYERVLSVNGVGHVVFIHASGDDSEIANNFINRNHIPNATRTFTECLKLIIEWAETAEEPWNNQSSIAQKAKQFIDRMEFTEEFIQQIKDNQVDMQVVQYLLGSQDARQRPQNVKEIFPEVTSYLEQNLSHLSLAGLLKFYPNAYDFKQMLEWELHLFPALMSYEEDFVAPESELKPTYSDPRYMRILKKQELDRLLSELSQ